eukprot:scaffold9393_cov93-Cylindrotheca_fusiformis.AAC.1
MQGKRAPAAAPPHAQPTELILLLYLFSARTRSAHGLRPCRVDCIDSSGGRPLRADQTREKTTSSPLLLSTFKYLGTTFDNTLDDSIDVKKRIQKANGAFAAMAKVLKDRKISTKLRLRTYEATVLNILYLGAKAGP